MILKIRTFQFAKAVGFSLRYCQRQLQISKMVNHCWLWSHFGSCNLEFICNLVLEIWDFYCLSFFFDQTGRFFGRRLG